MSRAEDEMRLDRWLDDPDRDLERPNPRDVQPDPRFVRRPLPAPDEPFGEAA